MAEDLWMIRIEMCPTFVHNLSINTIKDDCRLKLMLNNNNKEANNDDDANYVGQKWYFLHDGLLYLVC